jgi:hypothetical protein
MKKIDNRQNIYFLRKRRNEKFNTRWSLVKKLTKLDHYEKNKNNNKS